MSKLTDQLASIGIYNPHNLVVDGHPYITKEPYQWALTIAGIPEYPNGRFTFYGPYGSDWRALIALPLAKCAELFPDLEMVKGPWPNTYVPKVDLDAAKARIKARSQT